VALVVVATSLLGLPAQAAPPDPGPPPSPLVEGPWPPSRVLAVDPATVDPPVSAAAVNTCPAAPYGINRTAPGSGRTVALTFDDGPGASTDAILRILRDQGVIATFFNVGVNESVRPATVRAMRDQGHLLANHTWSHPDMSRLTAAQQAAEMDNESAQQASIVGSYPCFCRPPYGATNSTTLSLAQGRRMAVWNWSVDTEDWKANGSADQAWVDRIVSLAQAGGSQEHPVILLHNQASAMPATVAALPSIISFYKARGYTFVDLAGRTARTDRYVTGDWDGDGDFTPGVVRGTTWYLRNSNSAGPADVVLGYGGPTDRPIAGDWDGNGTWTPGVVRGNRWYLRNSNSTGPGTIAFDYAGPTDRVITGDWDGNGSFTPGIVRGNRWYLRNSNSTGPGTVVFDYAGPSDLPITGDWDANTTFTPGIVRGRTGWYLRNANSTGVASIAFTFAP
jgi:peptidoglycan/xylan/chitin deacetylase (PgdA/CDA1 family)